MSHKDTLNSTTPLKCRGSVTIALYPSASAIACSSVMVRPAAQRLQEMGLDKFTHMGGSIKAWKEASHPVE